MVSTSRDIHFNFCVVQGLCFTFKAFFHGLEHAAKIMASVITPLCCMPCYNVFCTGITFSKRGRRLFRLDRFIYNYFGILSRSFHTHLVNNIFGYMYDRKLLQNSQNNAFYQEGRKKLQNN